MMEMTELNEKALESRPATFTVDQDEVVGNLYYFALTGAGKPPYRTQRHVNAILDITDDGTLAGVELIDNMPPPPAALPTPDDGLVEKLRYRVENPSAWDTFDQGGSDLIAEATTALQYKDERIERLSVQLEASALVAVELSSRLDAAEQQAQKLTAENERLREATKESSRLLKDLDLGRSIHNSRFPQQKIDGPLWAQIPRICEIVRFALETQEGGK